MPDKLPRYFLPAPAEDLVVKELCRLLHIPVTEQLVWVSSKVKKSWPHRLVIRHYRLLHEDGSVQTIRVYRHQAALGERAHAYYESRIDSGPLHTGRMTQWSDSA